MFERPATQIFGAKCYAGVIVATLLLSGCPNQNNTPPARQKDDIDAAASRPTEVESIIARVSEGDTTALEDRELDSLKSWLAKTIVRGQTTKVDVIKIFGKRFLNLDRPERDSIVSIQYAVGTYGNETQLQFDFDPNTDVVTNWSLGNAICGFCPHVFVNDRQWRLEGKMLAGCVGHRQEGSDVLVLPRMQAHGGRLSVKLSNLAAELDYIDEVRLGIVELAEDEQLDVAVDGVPFRWQPVSGPDEVFQLTAGAGGQVQIPLNSGTGNAVVVLELRNTTAFETAMREFVRGESDAAPESAIEVEFDGRSRITIPPVGTKFYRRVVLPVPDGTTELRLDVPHTLWLMRRALIGRGRPVNTDIKWQTPTDAPERIAGIAAMLGQRDGRRICLEPMQEVELGFHLPEQSPGEGGLGYVLRMSGYYDFVQTPKSQ